jgi:hypothetical protein
MTDATEGENPERPEREANPLISRVDALMKRHQEESQRAVEEVPILTEVLEQDAQAEKDRAAADEALAADIERVLVVRLVPELNKQIAVMRGELEKEIRRTVRDAVANALAARKADDKPN